MVERAALLLLLVGCSDPAPPAEPPPTLASVDGVRVHVGGREVVVHCALTCAAADPELTRLSSDCISSPNSGPHRISSAGALLAIGCCEEAALAYDRGCGQEAFPGCAQAWTARCQGVQPAVPAIPDDERGVSGTRGMGH